MYSNNVLGNLKIIHFVVPVDIFPSKDHQIVFVFTLKECCLDAHRAKTQTSKMQAEKATIFQERSKYVYTYF